MKSNYVIPRTDVLPCRVGCLLVESQMVPYNPNKGTEDAFAKEFTLWDYELETERDYELGQENDNWFDGIDEWEE